MSARRRGTEQERPQSTTRRIVRTTGKVAANAGRTAIHAAPVDRCLNKYFSTPETWWLKVTLPLAEFLLLLTVLLLFLEVAPQDIPRKCGNRLLETCIARYNAGGGEFDAGFLLEPCGALRMSCWRGGIKSVIYNGDDMTAADQYYKAGVYERVNATLGAATAAQTELCQCMLTSNGTVAYPKSPNVKREDTEYFCDAIIASQNLGIVGLVLVVFVVGMKARLEELDNVDSVSDLQIAVGHLFIDLFWLGWSLLVVAQTSDYTNETGYVNADCQIPSGAIFYYVFVLGLLSALGASYSLYIALRVIVQILRENEMARGARLISPNQASESDVEKCTALPNDVDHTNVNAVTII